MEVIVIDSEAFLKLKSELEKVVCAAVRQSVADFQNKNTPVWITIAEAKKILPYNSRTTWQLLRDRGDLVYAKLGRKILYSRISIELYISKNKID